EDPSSNVRAGNNMHSSWSSEDGKYLYSARETADGTGDIRVYDISNPAQPLIVNSLTMENLGLNAVSPHNPVVKGNFLYVSWYQAGIQVFDISNPSAPRHVGQYDTYPRQRIEATEAEKSLAGAEAWDLICGSEKLQNALPTTFDGAWAVYPFLGENKVLAGDLTNGLFILDVTQATGSAKNIVADFDGDRKTDFSVYNPDTGVWSIENSSTGLPSFFTWGIPGDRPVPGDYDGDGKTDIAVFRPITGTWYLRTSGNGEYGSRNFGVNGDVPVPADYDADGRTDFAVWRPSDGTWYLQQSTLGFRFQAWGQAGDKPVIGDFEGDGKADLTMWRPSDGRWYVFQSSSSSYGSVHWGQNGDKPLFGDFDGDGRSEFTIYRPSTGHWYILNTTANTISTYHFGLDGDIAGPADFDGDGKADVGVFRPGTKEWFRLNSTDNAFIARPFGGTGDTPAPSAIQPQ
ncbi:MAG: FG-GAP-like repeat-containing protein, partial [Acidobacteria bacterium]|nr:FG-GAP-like repeat-containing protein [Acidobacteriota bacterium]